MNSFPVRPTTRFYLACVFAATSGAAVWLIAHQFDLVAAPVILLIYSWIFVALWVLAGHANVAGGFGKLSLARYVLLVPGIGLGMALAGIVGLIFLQSLGIGPGSSD